ncbi:MAG: MFS transporter [Anaerolineales bacterium]
MPRFVLRHLPLSDIPNIAGYYGLMMLFSTGFVAGNWIFFWTRFMTYGQLGVVDAVMFAFGLLMEVPTGAVADSIGGRRTLIVACALCFAGTLIVTLSVSFAMLIGGFAVLLTGFAFFSGAAEALAYDTLKARDQAAQFDRVQSSAAALGMVVAFVTTLAGGALYVLQWRLPHLAWSVGFLLAVVVAWRLSEPPVQRPGFSWGAYRRQLGRGFGQLWGPRLRPFLALILLLSAVEVLYTAGLISPAMAVSFGFFADAQAVIWAVALLAAAGAISTLPRWRRHLSDMNGLALLAALGGGGFLLAATQPGPALGVVILVGLMAVARMGLPWISVVVNHRIPSEARSTTLSTVALLAQIPYAATAWAAGAMVESGTFWIFNLAVGALLVGTMLVSWLAYHLTGEHARQTAYTEAALLQGADD